ncbi:hypothetical protein [Spirosoma fluviale]|nr:hypothetical protein [Spirosoma fluviale]
MSYRLPALKTTVKLGASSLANTYMVQTYGSPALGGLYDLTLSFDQLMR